MIIGLILPQECVNCYVARLTANPYAEAHNNTVVLPPCTNACDCYLRGSNKLSSSFGFPLLNKAGVQFSFADMYYGTDNKIMDMEMNVDLLQKIQRYPDGNMKFSNQPLKRYHRLKV